MAAPLPGLTQALGTTRDNIAICREEEMTPTGLCPDCQVGYHSPFERFEQLAVIPDGPAFLKRCTACGSLWQETLRDARRVTPTEAAMIFPGYAVQGTGRTRFAARLNSCVRPQANMSDFPERKEWCISIGRLSYILLVDQFGYVTDTETAPSPFAGGSATVSYADFLSGKRHSLIRSTFGEAVLDEALLLVTRNAQLLSGRSPAT